MAGQQKIRGVEDFQEMMAAANVRDPRPTATKIIDWLKVPNNLATVVFFIAAIAWFVPAIADLCLVIAGLLFWFGMTRRETLPLKFPMQSRAIDANEPDPGNGGKPGKAKGIFFLGNEVRSGKEVWLTNSDCRQHFLLLGTTGTGKALPLDAQVHTPTGWRELGSLKQGDRVSTPDGRSAQILGYYPQGELDIFKVTFEDGRQAEACGEHLWEVHHKHWNGKYKPGVSRAGAAAPRVLRTREIEELLRSNKGAFSVRLPEEVQKPFADLVLDPYLTGALLGDGGISGATLRFSSADTYIVEKVSKKLALIGHDLHQDDYAAGCDYRIRTADKSLGVLSPLRGHLRTLGLEGTKSDTKFIPDAFKGSSIEQRWALVQGLMDTDGTIDRRTGSLSFSTSSRRMAQDFQDVVRSLGGLAKLTEKNAFYKNVQGERIEGKTSYRVSVRHPRPASFFSLPRKLALVHDNYQYMGSLKLRIRSIEPARRAEAACILIDHPEHLFITDNYVVTHNTESLLGFASNAVSWGSGCLFIDGKGDVNTFASFYALARRFGREDDVLVMNYMTGNQDVGAGGGVLLSNTMNPFSHGASDTLTNMIVSLMDDVGGDGAMWKGRATAMLTGLMRALIWLRDNNRIDLNVGEIRDHMNLKRIIDLCDPSKYPDLPIHIRANIKSYLLSLPGFQEDKGYKQGQTTLDQHGYLEMQFTRILGSLADVYGHIFKTPFGEIDMNDVVLNRRLLLIMLPALEKSSDEIANLGKIVVATLRGMMGSTLGSAIEGAWQDIVENRLTKSPSPFIVILDEVGYYMVDGMDLMAAQARSLGFSLVFAGQDLNAMKRISEKVFGSVLGNTRTKVLLGTEDTETMELASKLGGKSLRTHMSGFTGETGEFGKRYSDNMEARIEEVERIHGLDIKAQGPGEAHIMFADKLVRVNMFYPAPNTTLNPRKLTLRTNHFITVGHPNVEAILSQQRLPDIVEKLCDPDFAKMMRHDADNAVKNLSLSGELEPLHTAISEGKTKTQAITGPLDVYCAGFAQIVNDVESMTADYQQQVPNNMNAAALSNMPGADFTLDRSADQHARRPRNIENPQTGFGNPDRQASTANVRRPAEASSFEGEIVPANLAPSAPRRPDSKPFRSSRIDGKVRHGVNVDGNVHDMVHKLPAVPGVLDALDALDADGMISTKKEIDAALNDAIKFADDVDDLGFLAPATKADIKKANDSTQRVMPDFEFADDGEIEGESDGDGDGKDGSTMDFLTSLIETEGA